MFAPPLRALIERQLAELVEARLPRGRRLAALQIAAAQLAVLDTWVSGATRPDQPSVIRPAPCATRAVCVVAAVDRSRTVSSSCQSVRSSSGVKLRVI